MRLALLYQPSQMKDRSRSALKRREKLSGTITFINPSESTSSSQVEKWEWISDTEVENKYIC